MRFWSRSDRQTRLRPRWVWNLWDQLLTQEIARLAHCEQSAVEKREERQDPLYYRLLKSFVLGSYEGSPGEPVEALDADRIVRISERVVEDAGASGSCVIVGRGSQHFLRSRDDTLRFFLYASREEKISRLISEGNSEREAERLLIQSTVTAPPSFGVTSPPSGLTVPYTTP